MSVNEYLCRYANVALLTASLISGGAVAVWASSSPDRVVAAGTIAPDPGIADVRAGATGSLREILVNDGEKVEPGEVVARLDDSSARSQAAQIADEIDALLLRLARLDAERNGRSELVVPEELAGRVGEPAVKEALDAERKALSLRNSVYEGRKRLLGERITLAEEEIHSYAVQARTKAREIELISNELRGARQLREKKLLPITRLTALEREAVRLEGERNGVLAASIAQAKARIADIRLQLLQSEQDYQHEISQERKAAAARLCALRNDRSAAEARMRQAEIRATRNGIVHRSPQRFVGEVVSAGQQVMRIAPHATVGVTVEASLTPRKASLLRSGQVAELKLAAAGMSGPVKIKGTLTHVGSEGGDQGEAGDVLRIRAQVEVPPHEATWLNAVAVQPGNVATLVVETAKCSSFYCLMQPIATAVGEAFSWSKPHKAKA